MQRVQRTPRPATIAVLACLLMAQAGALAQAGKYHRRATIGAKAPGFERLPATDGRRYGLADFAAARFVVVVFTADHCPVAAAYDSRLVALERDYRARGVQMIFISCSAPEPGDLKKMGQRAAKQGFKFPYLHDATQAVGRAYGASVTPGVFVLDGERRFAYLGAVDDQWSDPNAVKHAYLRDALDALLAGRTPELAETRPVGCAIQYEEP